MNIKDAKNFRRNYGIVSPTGIKYIPNDMDELKYIFNEVSSYSATGIIHSLDVDERKHYNTIDFWIDSGERCKQLIYYIDLDTVELEILSKIRNLKIEEII